jgi:16S rRNA (cytosine1402-N4)-methyltransferase
MGTYRHVSAMLSEAITYLNCVPGGIYVDGTLGGSGHAGAICRAIMPDGMLIGIDQDQDAIAHAQHQLQPYAPHIHLFHGNFISLPEFMAQLNVDAVHGILLDLGLSQHQLEASGRGFSFQRDEPLDMRMDVRTETRARDLVNHFSEEQLYRVFRDLGEERWSRRIARAVVNTRQRQPLRTSRQLAELVSSAVPRAAAAKQKIHPATRVFMALRIAVNKELERLDQFLEVALECLRPKGRLVVLSFHSLEDRAVKRRFKQLAQGCRCPSDLPQCVCGGQPLARILTKKVVRPSSREIDENPMARSTKLRAMERLMPGSGFADAR